jgi:spermidine synthase
LFHHLRREVGELGGVAGRVYSWNTLGSLAGAVLGGYALLFWLDLHHVYRIAVGALALGAAILSVRVLGVPRLAAGAAAAIVCATLVLGFGPWEPKRMAAGLFRFREPAKNSFAGPSAFFSERDLKVKTLVHRDDPTTTVTIREFDRGDHDSRSVTTNGKSDGDTTGDYPTMGLAALVPSLLAEKHERAFVIGWGLGITVGELAALDGLREVHVAEISREVLRAAPLFDFANQRASRSPKVHATRSDAYRALLRSQGSFDVIASEPSNPWVTGVEMLYSQEFLSVARDKLAPGGVYAQWFHLYETDFATVELVLRTYRAVFDHVAVWYTMGPDLLLLGFRSPERIPDVATLRRRFGQPDFHAGFARSKVDSFEILLAHEVLPMDALAAAELPGPIHTLRHPLLSHHAARAFFRGQASELPRLASVASAEAGARNSLLRRAALDDGEPIPEDVVELVAHETCGRRRPIECAVFLARGLRDHPGSTRLGALRDELRRKKQLGPGVTDEDLDRLVELHGGPRSAARGSSSLQQARQMSDAYFRFFTHAVPFDRQVLEQAWQRCREPAQIEACRSGRSDTLRRLGLDAVRTASSLAPTPP